MDSELYKKYRPDDFGKLVGNQTAIDSMRKAISENRFPHCVLFAGPSGCGKTTAAMILKKHLECSDNDFIEVNCANHNGVEFARDIEAKIQFKPMNGKSRIWLLDECHRMTSACANVLLKPFEFTPKHVYFILATTEPESIIDAVKTRATPYFFQPLAEDDMRRILTRISRREKIEFSEKVFDQIIINAGGSARLALVLLDQLRGLDEKQANLVITEILKKEAQAIELSRALIYQKKWLDIQPLVQGLQDDPEKTRRAVIGYCKSILLSKDKNHWEIAFAVMQCFEAPFYNTGFPGLVKAAYEAATAVAK